MFQGTEINRFDTADAEATATYYRGYNPIDEVLLQADSAGAGLLVVALVSALTAMRLAIHGHEVAVPDLVGNSPAAARMIAEQNGLDINVERQYYSPTVPEGKILSQLPPAGSQVRRGWQVRVAESLGPQRVEIPNVMGQSQRIANINIRRRGLDVGAIAQMRLTDCPRRPGVVAGTASQRQRCRGSTKVRLLVAQSSLPQASSCPASSDSLWAPPRSHYRTPGCVWER